MSGTLNQNEQGSVIGFLAFLVAMLLVVAAAVYTGTDISHIAGFG